MRIRSGAFWERISMIIQSSADYKLIFMKYAAGRPTFLQKSIRRSGQTGAPDKGVYLTVISS